MEQEIVGRENGIHIPDSELPTTPELVKKGVEVYESVLAGIATTPFRNAFFKSSPTMEKCFVGVFPDVTFQYLGPNMSDTSFDLSPDSVRKLSELVSQITPDMVMGVQKSTSPNTKRVFLLNLMACERVIRNHQEFFPEEAIASPREWLVTDVDAWQQNAVDDPTKRAEDIRFGLLSGYPVWSVIAFQGYRDAMRAYKTSEIPQKDKGFLDDYLRDYKERTDQQRQRARDTLSQISLSPRDQELLITGEFIASPFGINVKSFDFDRDNAYIARLEKLFQNSGITAVTKKFRGN